MSELMINARAGTASQTCDAPLPASIASLPLELLTAILGYLDQNAQLWQAAAVSRIFYTAAWQAGLIIQQHILWSGSIVPSIATIDEIVQHAARSAPHLRLGLSFSAYPPPGRAYRPSVMADTERILGSITAALPLLVWLSLDLHVHFSAELAHALCHAAPHLEELELALHNVSDRTVPTVPGNLFAGAAPLLRKVVLRDAYLGPAPVAVFSGVTELVLAYSNLFPDPALVEHFPQLSDLTLEFSCASGVSQAEPPARLVGLRAGRLRRLCVRDEDCSPLMPTVAASVDLRAIPDLEHAGDDVVWTPHPWGAGDAVAVRISCLSGPASVMCMRVLPATPPRRWRRTHVAREWSGDTLTPLAALPEAAVTRLRLHGAYLERLLDTPQLCLGELRELHVDLDSDFTPDTTTAAVPGPGCVRLETLRLCASECAPTLDAGAVATLGLALGLLPLCALDLAGVQLVGASALLEKRFSSVRVVGPDCCVGDQDGYSWE